MGSVVIRNLDDSVLARYRCRAKLHGRSLEAELRDALTAAAPLAPEQKMALSSKLRAMSPGWSGNSADLIREDRDSR